MFLAPGRMLYAGALGPTSVHAHHAYQIAIGLRQPLAFRTAEAGELTGCAFVIPSDAPHAVATPCPAAVLVYVDPEHMLGRRLRRACEQIEDTDWVTLAAPLSGWRVPLPDDWEQAMSFIDDLVHIIAPNRAHSKPVHPAVMRATVSLKRRLQDGQSEVSLVALAREANLSASRLSHLFAESVGIPLRPYVLWQRMIMAATAIEAGLTLTAAAHHAGFTDSAHLTHTFHRMFGVSPSEGVGAIEWVVRPST